MISTIWVRCLPFVLMVCYDCYLGFQLLYPFQNSIHWACSLSGICMLIIETVLWEARFTILSALVANLSMAASSPSPAQMLGYSAGRCWRKIWRTRSSRFLSPAKHWSHLRNCDRLLSPNLPSSSNWDSFFCWDGDFLLMSSSQFSEKLFLWY